MLEIIRVIYMNRRFQILVCTRVSQTRRQHSGISQGCPLSLFLFVMSMTDIMTDACGELQQADTNLLDREFLPELLAADHT